MESEMKNLEQYQAELSSIVEKYQDETRAGLLLKHGLELFMTLAFEIAHDKEKVNVMIQDLLWEQKTRAMAVDQSLYLNKYFKFKKNNKIPWSQDFCCYTANAPHGIKFLLDKFINEERVTLKAFGYGELGKEKGYGNGAICVNIKDIIPYMVKE